MNQSKPRLRWPLNIEPVELKGENYIVIRDQHGLAPRPAVFPHALFPLVARFDGTRSIREIVDEGRAFGVTDELVEQVVATLASMNFMDTAETRARWEEVKVEYRAQAIREEALAGIVYPREQGELRSLIDGFVEKSAAHHFQNDDSRDPIGLICPHIDYRRGWHTYGTAYSILKQLRKPDVIFLLGTAHQASEGYFHLTKKHFQTPLGTFNADHRILDGIFQSYGSERLLRDEILHKREHSLELQLPFLAHRFAGEGLPSLVPILVGSFHESLLRNRAPVEVAEIGDFVETLAGVIQMLRLSGTRVLFYGGVDLAHVGLHFGDDYRVSDNGLDHIEQRDRELLGTALDGDEEALFAHLASDLDARRICGFPSIYTMLAVLRRAGVRIQGKLVEYRQAVEKEADCVVTFASACWFEV